MKKLYRKIKEYLSAVESLRQAKKHIRNLETQNKFLIETLENADIGIETSAEAKEKIANYSYEMKAKKRNARREELEELKEDLEFMYAIPVSGKNAMLERERAITAHQERIFEIETEELA